MKWTDITEFMEQVDERRMADIPHFRPSDTIWAMTNVWEALNGSSR